MISNILLFLVLLVGFSYQSGVNTELMRKLLISALNKHLPQPQQRIHDYDDNDKRAGRQIQSADPGAIMYLPIGGSGNIRLA